MIHLRVWKYRFSISKRVLWVAIGIVLAVMALLGLYAVGTWVTPASATDRPPVLAPSLWAAERYRARVRGWLSDLAEIDRRLTVLLNVDASETAADTIYAHSQEMQAVGETAATLAQQVSDADPPVALVGLQVQVEETTNQYLEAALATARWLNAPSEERRRSASDALGRAHRSRIALEESQWIQYEN